MRRFAISAKAWISWDFKVSTSCSLTKLAVSSSAVRRRSTLSESSLSAAGAVATATGFGSASGVGAAILASVSSVTGSAAMVFFESFRNKWRIPLKKVEQIVFFFVSDTTVGAGADSVVVAVVVAVAAGAGSAKATCCWACIFATSSSMMTSFSSAAVSTTACLPSMRPCWFWLLSSETVPMWMSILLGSWPCFIATLEAVASNCSSTCTLEGVASAAGGTSSLSKRRCCSASSRALASFWDFWEKRSTCTSAVVSWVTRCACLIHMLLSASVWAVLKVADLLDTDTGTAEDTKGALAGLGASVAASLDAKSRDQDSLEEFSEIVFGLLADCLRATVVHSLHWEQRSLQLGLPKKPQSVPTHFFESLADAGGAVDTFSTHSSCSS